MNELYIDRGITQSRVAVFKDEKPISVYLENHNNNNKTGNIYKGRIENVVEGLKAAFVNIGTNKNALLHFEDTNDKLKPKKGQEVIVQVIREGTKDKGPRVTEKISIPGKYIIMLPNQKYIGISKKITEKENRETLKNIAFDIYEAGYGLIMRTEAVETDYENLIHEYNYLKNIWRYINEASQYIKPPYILFNAKDFYNYILREFIKNEIDIIYLNRENDKSYLGDIIRKVKPDFKGIIEYTGHDFSKINKIDKAIDYIMENRISLPSGGFLVIDKSEALVSIDVNTGKFTETQEEEATLKTNLEACKKIYEIITLKNLSGIIIIDFIDMKEEKSREAIINSLKSEFKNDRVSNKIYGFTALGLLEMARARKGRRISEFIFEDEKKSIFNVSYLLKKIENACLKALKNYKIDDIKIYISPELSVKVQEEYDFFSREMMDTHGIKVNFKVDKGIENFYIDMENKGINLVKVDLGTKIIHGKLINLAEKDGGTILIEIKKV